VESSCSRASPAPVVGSDLGVCRARGLVGWPLVPPPSVIYDTFYDLAAAGELQFHVITTLGRVGAGFGLGAASGAPFGLVPGYAGLCFALLIRRSYSAGLDPFLRM
jgi:ABC-type nitrate/sulfonate/bicarbonate transport system permease component